MASEKRTHDGLVAHRIDCRVFLVVEDDVDRSILHFLLADDHSITEFERIDDAEQNAHWPADLVIVAAALVASSGPQLIARWRVLWPTMKILVVCEACDDDCIAAALHAGADDTLTRPFRSTFVRNKIERVFDDMPAYPRSITARIEARAPIKP